mmetsp:Transcript_63461/g.174737  ORF Transcript_63461/g.174737 Transcript_63461/m.174737 type:complete len:198 (+) Transcript_63461:152-745(+)
MSDVEAQKAEGETDKASLTEDPKELMRQAIRKRHRNYLVGFFVVVFFILIISFCAFRQPRISWRKFLQEGTDSNGDKVYTVYMQYKNTNWYPIHFGQMKAPLISYGAEGSGNTGTEVGTCTFKAFECQARVSTFYPAKCMRTCTLDYSETESTFVDLVEDECDKGAGSSLYMAGKSTATNGPSTFNVQMSDSYFYSC